MTHDELEDLIYERTRCFVYGSVADCILELIAAERAAEREACVELCLEHSKLNVDSKNAEFSHLASYEFGKQVGAATCATAIRSRGEKND